MLKTNHFLFDTTEINKSPNIKTTNMKNFIHFMGAIFLFLNFSFNAVAQCTNTSPYGSATAPDAGASATISGCNYFGEYSTISSVVSGQEYTCSNSGGGYVTVRSGSSSGTVVAHGDSPLTWTAATSGSHYVHWNTNSGCGSQSGCVTTTIAATAAAIPATVAPYTESCDANTYTDWTFSSTSGAWVHGTSIGWNTTYSATPSDNTGNGGSFLAVDHSGTDTEVIAETPEFDVSGLTSPELEFYRYASPILEANGYPHNPLRVDYYNGSSWSTAATYSTGTWDTWEKKTIDLSSFVYNTDRVKLRFIANDGGPNIQFYQDQAIDDIKIQSAASCGMPTTPTSSSITNTTATIGWTAPSSAPSNGYEYYYSTSSSAPTSSTTASGSVGAGTTSANITGLTAATTYYFWVRSNCGSGSYSNWSDENPVPNFTTFCDPESIPYTQGFESGYTNGSALSSCLTQESVVGNQLWYANDGTWTTYDRTPRSGSWNMWLQNSNTDWLMYSVSLTAGTEYLFECYARQDGSTSSNATITLAYGTSATAAAMTNTVVSATGVINGNYQLVSGTFTPSSTGTYFIGILGTISGANYMSIDDISLTLAPTCFAPNSLTSSNLAVSTASIGWSAPGTAPSNGYEYYYSTSSSAPTSGTTASGSVGAGVLTASLSGLSANTTYYYWVRGYCGGSDYSDWTSSANFTTACQLTAPLTESFDAESTPTCWGISSTSGDGWQFSASPAWQTFYQSAPSDNSGNSGAVAWVDFSGTDAGVILQSPEIDVSALTTPYLDFYHYMNGTGYTPLNILYVEAYDGSSAWSTVATINTESASWSSKSYDVSSYTYNTNSLMLRFRAESGGSADDFYGDMAIDDIRIIEAPSPTITSFTPTTLCEGASVTITGTNFTGAASVTFGGTAATSYTVNSDTEISAVVGSGTTGAIAIANAVATGTSSSSLTVNANPSAVTVTAASVCSGSSGNLTASGGSGGTIYWQTSSGGTSTSNSGATSPAYSSTGTYYAISQSAAGCWGTEGSAVFTVNDNPSPSATASATGVCSGSTVDLTGSSSSSDINATTSPGATVTNGSPVSSTYVVSGHGGSASDLSSITLNVTHSWNSDLSITLTAPDGSSIDLSSNNGGSGDNYTNTVFSASGGSSITSGSAPFTGTYTPEEPFSNLTGNSDGTWTLTVSDGAAGDDGNFVSWNINIPAISVSETYAWSSNVGGYSSSSQNPTGVSPAENTTYTYILTDANGCTGSADVSVTYDQPAAIATTVDGSSVSSGASFRLDQTIGWTSTSSSGIGFIWDADEASPYSNYNWAWTSPATWSDNAGNFLNGGDSRTLYLRARNVNNVTCYSDAVTAVLRKPLVSTSGTLTSFANCEGTAATEQSFTVTGQYLTNDLTVTAPTGFEVSASSGSGYASSITLTPTAGSVSATVYVQIPSTTSSGSPSGDITCSSVHNLNGSSTSASATVSATGTVTAVPTITSSTGATICATGTVDLAAASSAGTINWYTALTGGSSQGTGTSFTTPSISATTIYYVDATDGSCTTGSRTAVTATVNSAPDAGTLTVDLTEALSTQTINWTNSGVSNGTRAYWYQWNDDNTSAPTGTWVDFGASSEAHSWGAGSAGANMNRTLWVKTIVTTDQGCPGSPAESTPVYTDVINCKAGTTTASVSAGTVANMPFGETITYTSGTPGDGSFERFQYQWGGTSGTWSDWSTSNPNVYTTDINAGQTLYVRAKITGADAGSGGCIDYSNNIQTLLIDCASTVAASAGSDVDLCNGSSVALSGSGSGSNVSSYSWSPNTEISSTSSATPTVSATSSRTYTLTNTHDNGCTSTDDIVVTVVDGPSITTATDLTTAANTCGQTSLEISHSGTGGNGEWTYSGGTVAFTVGSSTDPTVSVSPNPSDVNTDITMTWTVASGEVCDGATASKVIHFNQPTSVASPDTYTYLWGGLTSTDISTGANWYKWDATNSMWARQSSAPNASTDKLHVLTTDNNCIHSTNTLTLGTTTLASLNVGSSATMDLGSGTITLNGDLTNAGTITAGSGTVSLTATGDQTFSGAGTTSFNNLTVNKTSDNLILSSAATVEGTLTMNKGNISNGSNVLTIGTSSASTGSITHNSGSVLGKLRRYYATGSNSSKDFPIGTASKTRDATIAFSSSPGTNQYLTASYNAGYPQLSGEDLYAGLPLTTSDGQLIQNYDDEGYWEITPGSTSTGESYSAGINSKAYNITLHMNGLTGANSASMDRTKVRIIKSAGPSHTSWVALTHGSISGSADSDYTVTASGTGFSFFGAGTEDDNALPVELVSFNGSCNDGVVDLSWQTASENNSEDFEVEYSRDGIDWNLIHTEPAAGFSTELITYNYEHKQAISGDNYYRLTQNDIDGASVIYENLVINASCQSTANGYFSIFPNPSSGSFQVVMNSPEIEGVANLNISDTKGNKVFTKQITVNSGINMYVIQEALAPGIYYINVENGSRTTTIVKHSIR